jgi:hypothetical protein
LCLTGHGVQAQRQRLQSDLLPIHDGENLFWLVCGLMAYEYQYFSMKENDDNVTDKINQWADAGWELDKVAVNSWGQNNYHFLYFRREKTGGT